ncbi:cysteine synthase B [Streptomyces sp. L-9-10]|uniref:PLP-dependent cysteine synthase family protein n=1 Tax=Streptomyces sp. L-9-10 TaxID=1478131 RepID=UPI00101DB7F0|nr:PLP-dependent cysteine synthase family protein [Streptomyces sp. L-9-10]RYJ24543.1 cysteine synthase B [Streptomyces sp. L-9-10]
MGVSRRAVLLAGAGTAAATAAVTAAGTALAAGGSVADAVVGAGRSARAEDIGRDDDLSDRYPDERGWVNDRIRRIRALPYEPTPMLEMELPRHLRGSRLLVKNESVHPSGSHKHRLAEALFLNALANGWLVSDSPVVEASSGSTAISEAWFSRLLGIKFVAVVPSGTTTEKKQAILDLGGEIVEATGATISERAQEEARVRHGHFMDQFTYAERAYDWRGDHGMASEILGESDPDWFVMGAGTGGTAASLARYARYTGHRVRVCVTDPENSAFFPGWRDNDRTATAKGSRIEGIGRPKVEPSFLFPLVNRMIRVPDAVSIATMRVAEERLGIAPGGSTGTGLYGALKVLRGLHRRRERGTVVTVLCDSGERYLDTYYSDEWLDQQGIDFRPWVDTVERFFETGRWTPPRSWRKPPTPRGLMWNM